MSVDWSRENMMRGEQKVISQVRSAWQGFKGQSPQRDVMELEGDRETGLLTRFHIDHRFCP